MTIFLRFTDGVQKEPHLNGGSELSPRVPVEVPPTSMLEPSEPEPEVEQLELIAPPPASSSVVVPPKEEEVKAEPSEPELEHLESITATEDQEVQEEEKPVIIKEEVAAPVVAAPVPVVTPANVANPEPNEKPTYANLFKKSGNTAVVATGSISLPPAGFGKSFAVNHHVFPTLNGTPPSSINSETLDYIEENEDSQEDNQVFEGKIVVHDYKKFKRSKTFKNLKAIHGMNLRNFLILKDKSNSSEDCEETQEKSSSEEDICTGVQFSSNTPWSEICKNFISNFHHV